MRIWPSALACSILAVTAWTAPRPRIWANRYGARGDARTLNTLAIQRALNAAARRHGIVEFQPGIYLTGAIFVRSHTWLHIGRGVTLRGVDDLAAYPILPTRVAGIDMRWPAALLNVYRQRRVRIYGHGVLDGQGNYWWKRYWQLRRKYTPLGLRWASDYDCRRPRLVQIYRSHWVRFSGLRLIRSGFWTVHVCYSRHVRVSNLTIRNNIGGRGPSTDGIDIDSSSRVRVLRCDISDNDDAICLKAGRDADGLRVNRPTTHIAIRDCVVRDGAAGFTIGSETSGGFRDVLVDGLRVYAPVPAGIKFKSAHTRGGLAHGIQIRNLILRGVRTVFDFNMNWDPSYSYAKFPAGWKHIPFYWRIITQPVLPARRGLPQFRDVRIANLRALNAGRIFAASAYAAAPLRNFSFRHLSLTARAAGFIRHARGWKFSHIRVKTTSSAPLQLRDVRRLRGWPGIK